MNITNHDSALKEAIRRLPIHVLWVRLGLPGTVRPNCCICSPLRDDDRRPSFSIFADGSRFKDHGDGVTGDSFDFYCRITKMNPRTAFRAFCALAGVRPNRRSSYGNRY
jgi:hypothetical protein